MSLFNHFICASSNAVALMLEAYENKKQAQKLKYFDISRVIVNPSIHRSKFVWEVDRGCEYFEISDHSDFYTYNLMRADAILSLAKKNSAAVLNVWGFELSLSGDFKGAAKKYEEAYYLTRDNNYRAFAFNALGNEKYFEGDYKKAIKYYKKALSLSNIDYNNVIFKNDIIDSLKTWAEDLFYQTKYYEAAQKYIEAYQLIYNDNQVDDLGSASQKLLQEERYDEAIILNNIAFYLAKDHEEKLDIHQTIAYILESWGDRLFVKSFFKEAGQKYLEAYQISYNLDHKMFFFMAKAEELSQQKLYRQALEDYDKALELAVDDIDLSTIYYGKSLILRCLSKNLRENKSSVSFSNSKIVEDLKKKKHDFIYAIQTDDNPEEVEVLLTEALCNVETILCYFPDLGDYAKVADEVKDLLSRSYDGELLLGKMQEYQFETDD